MRWLAPLVVILAAAPARAQQGEAEKLYRAMEKKILAAKTLVVEFNSHHTVADKKEPSKFTVKGTIHIAPGNKTRLDLESEIFQLGRKNLIVTNGESKYAKVGNLVFREGPFPAKGQVFLAMLARFGAAVAALEQKIDTVDLDKDCPIKSFKLGAKELVGTREAQVVEYRIQNEKTGDRSEWTVWIDTKTQLPLKRTEAARSQRSTETYSVFTLDSKLDDKLFEVPAK